MSWERPQGTMTVGISAFNTHGPESATRAQLAWRLAVREPMACPQLPFVAGQRSSSYPEVYMGSLVKKRRKKMSKHKYRKRIKANRHSARSEPMTPVPDRGHARCVRMLVRISRASPGCGLAGCRTKGAAES